MTVLEVADSARKHGVTEEDILHAIRNAVREITDGERTLLIGPDRASRLLEVVALDFDSNNPIVIHAMVLRTKFFRFL